MIKWVLLSGAVTAEVIGSLSLRAAGDQPAWYVTVVLGYLTAFILLSAVLRIGVPLGVAYGIWAAAGVAATAIMSAILFDEPLTALMCGGIALVIAGVLIVEFGSHRAEHQRAA